MSISRQDVERVARLARLSLTDAETEQLRGQLGAIVDYMQLLSSVDTSGIAPDLAGGEHTLAGRPDEVHAGLTTEDALADAPERTADSFCVPAFVEEP
jgi:aspartyl-tRNA(Asn)/glutamyl-tRNA(Gln) amidotransferase subunit C